MITSKFLRNAFLSFFEEKNHTIVPSSSLVPENDPTSLFINAGMQPLVPYLGGEKHPAGKRICDVQKCIRTIDIDEVGDKTHLTFFEMLGNWSLGDYFKKESLTWSYEFLTHPKYLNIPHEKIAVSIYQGNQELNVPKDTQSYEIWKSLGISDKRIVFLGDEDNWWPKMGINGLCGPDSEIFYWTGEENAPETFDPEDDRWMEIWNNVFMQYRFQDEKLSELENKNVDTGMGLERLLVTLNGAESVYDTDLFTPAREKLEKLSGKKYGENDDTTRSLRIILDHLRAATFIIGDGITPSNVDQGYILRRLLRRAIRQGIKIGIQKNFTADIAHIFIETMKDFYTELSSAQEHILKVLHKEETKFKTTLDKGIREFEKIVEGMTIAYQKTGKKIDTIAGKKAFKLYDTYGFPIEMTCDLAEEKDLKVDKEGFEKAYTEHREKSKQGASQKFSGGMADHSEQTKKLHTATHLMLQALKMVLGDHVSQRGSNITEKRLRFDFSHNDKLTAEQIQRVETIVNEQIQKNVSITCEEMSVEEAMKLNATGIFVDKYTNDLGGKVKVYFMGDFSTEICGGPHTESTGVLGKFRITKEQSSSAGVRRIKAILEEN